MATAATRRPPECTSGSSSGGRDLPRRGWPGRAPTAQAAVRGLSPMEGARHADAVRSLTRAPRTHASVRRVVLASVTHPRRATGASEVALSASRSGLKRPRGAPSPAAPRHRRGVTGRAAEVGSQRQLATHPSGNHVRVAPGAFARLHSGLASMEARGRHAPTACSGIETDGGYSCRESVCRSRWGASSCRHPL